MKSTIAFLGVIAIIITTMILLNIVIKKDPPIGPGPMMVDTSISPISSPTEHMMTQEEHNMMMNTETSQDSTDRGTPVIDTPATEDPAIMRIHNTPETRTFTITGKNFAYDVKEIRVKKGDGVMIHFMSSDGTHDLVIDELAVHSENVQQGNMTMITFSASKIGVFEYYCSNGSHRAHGMVGKIIVEE